MKSFNCFRIIFIGFILSLFCFDHAHAQTSTKQAAANGVRNEDVVKYRLNPNGNPIQDAEIYIFPETGISERIKKTDHLGTYHFKNLKKGKYTIGCKLPGSPREWSSNAESVKPKRLYVNLIVDGPEKGPISFGSKTGKNPLCFDFPDLILEKDNNSFAVQVLVSVNNYGINDEGIK